MKLEFQSSNGNRRVIGYPKDRNETWKLIKDFLDQHHFKSYYSRVWKNEDGETVFDVGSHTEFFFLSECDEKDHKQIQETKEEHQMKGIVKWFDAQKGYGFIVDDDKNEHFVHYKDIVQDGFKTLNQNDKVSFMLGVLDDGRKKAIHVKVEG